MKCFGPINFAFTEGCASQRRLGQNAIGHEPPGLPLVWISQIRKMTIPLPDSETLEPVCEALANILRQRRKK